MHALKTRERLKERQEHVKWLKDQKEAEMKMKQRLEAKKQKWVNNLNYVKGRHSFYPTRFLSNSNLIG